MKSYFPSLSLFSSSTKKATFKPIESATDNVDQNNNDRALEANIHVEAMSTNHDGDKNNEDIGLIPTLTHVHNHNEDDVSENVSKFESTSSSSRALSENQTESTREYYAFKPKKHKGKGSSLDGTPPPLKNKVKSSRSIKPVDKQDYLTTESEKYRERVAINGMATTPDDIGELDRETFSSIQRQEPKSQETLTPKEYENFMNAKGRAQMSNELNNAKKGNSKRPQKTTPDELGKFSRSTKSSTQRNDKSIPKHASSLEKIESMKGKERSSMSNELQNAKGTYSGRKTTPKKVGNYAQATKSSIIRNTTEKTVDTTPTKEHIGSQNVKERKILSTKMTDANEDYTSRINHDNVDNLVRILALEDSEDVGSSDLSDDHCSVV